MPRQFLLSLAKSADGEEAYVAQPLRALAGRDQFTTDNSEMTVLRGWDRLGALFEKEDDTPTFEEMNAAIEADSSMPK